MRVLTKPLSTLLICSSTAFGGQQTWSVCPAGCDFSNIQSAISASSDGDTVQIEAGTYSHFMAINPQGKAITIRGTKASDGTPLTIIDGQLDHWVFQCQSNEGPSTRLENLVIKRGNGVGIYIEGCSPTLKNCWINDNAGTGIRLDGSSATLIDCRILNNEGGGGGGGILIAGSGSPHVLNSVISGNSSGQGGGGRGGGIFVSGATPVFESTVVSGNLGSGDGGGIYSLNSSVRLVECIVRSNNAMNGGGIACWSSTFQLEGTNVCNNTASTGPQIYVVNGDVDVDTESCVQASCQLCEPDLDLDGIVDSMDNCPSHFNPTQADCDQNGVGDVCELANGQSDANSNGVPDLCECLGDLTGNGVVDGADLGLMLNAWGSSGGEFDADINGDGTVNGADLGRLVSRWGPCN